MNINKNISVWRGDNTPPTIYHLWIKSDNSIYLFLQDKWTKIDQRVMESIDNLYYYIYSNLAELQYTVTPPIIEKGVSTPIRIDWKVVLNGERIVPESLELSSGNTILVDKNYIEYYNDNISDTKEYKLSVTLEHGVTFDKDITVTAIKCPYIGFSGIITTEEQIQNLNKQDLTLNLSGEYNITNNAGGQFLWICTPNTISEVISNNITIPMEDLIKVEDYNCYRSSKMLKSGTFKFIIK